MKKFRLLILLVPVFFLLNSCKKDNPSRTDMLAGKYWINTACTIDPPIMVGTTPITDFFSQMNQCDRDDLQKFDANGIYTFDEGVSKCATNDPQTSTGTWAWNSTETIATVTIGAGSRSYTVLELSSSKLVAKYSELADYGSGNLMYTYTITAVVH